MAEEIQRDPELWLEDGNLVIVANAITKFRVYKGLLGRVSAVFRDTFECAAPDPGEMIDDCPVVRVPDSPVEMGYFLRAVFRPGAFISSEQTLPFATIASVMRIAHKYQAQEIIDTASRRLESFLVPRPGHWIDCASLSWEDRWTLGQAQCGIAFKAEDAIEAVNLARLVDKPRMLPVALYLCCHLSAVQLRNGVARAGGDPDFNAVEKLSDEDFARCVVALPVLGREYYANVLRALNEEFIACPNCEKKTSLQLRGYEREARLDRTCALSDILVRVDRRVVLSATWKRNSLCFCCRNECSRLSAVECLKTRERLAEIFGLGDLQRDGWEETHGREALSSWVLS